MSLRFSLGAEASRLLKGAVSVGGLVRGDQDPGGGCFRVHEPERLSRTSVREQPPSRPEHERVDHQQVLVDQPFWHQRLDELTAAHDLEVLARLLLQLSNSSGHLPLEQGRVRPWQWLAKRARRNVLRRHVESVLERAVLGLPVAQHVLVAAPSEQQTATLDHPLAKRSAGHVIVARHRPPALLEAAPPVLVGTAWPLHDTVKRHVVDDDDSSHPIT